ncbi:MAG: GntR family transcriptional regulator [Oscillospiraceae bacterium]|nr:GntR family transcriptional regulator [Oscillospiraceae bacterium]
MRILIDNKSGVPIYDQICTQIREQIVGGALREDEALPSIRNLAKDLKLSVITTKRAYEELEREGLIYTVPAKGCFVAGLNRELLREHHLRRIEEHLAEAARLAVACGVTEQELAEMLRLMWEEER